MRHNRSIVAAALVLALAATACGGGGDESDDAVLVDADAQVVIDDVTTTTSLAETSGGAAEGDSDAGSGGTTIPLNEVDATTELFDAAAVFMQCMDDSGGFIGVPNEAAGVDAPVNAEPYRESLRTCAARSNVVDALDGASAEAEDLDPEEVENRNRGFLEFRECLTGRGWQVPLPEPNEIGLLFGGNIARDALSWRPPEGEVLLESDDLGECGESIGLEGLG